MYIAFHVHPPNDSIGIDSLPLPAKTKHYFNYNLPTLNVKGYLLDTKSTSVSSWIFAKHNNVNQGWISQRVRTCFELRRVTPPNLGLALKAPYTFSNCQRQVFPLGVSHHKHKITSLWKFGLSRSSKLRENDEKKTPLLDEFVCLQIGIKDF